MKLIDLQVLDLTLDKIKLEIQRNLIAFWQAFVHECLAIQVSLGLDNSLVEKNDL